MKKLLLLSMTLYYLSFITNAQETVLFSGDATTSMFSRMDLIEWAMGEATEGAYYVNFGTAEAPAFTEVGVNPDKTGVNTTDNALHMATTKGHSWWPDFLIMKLTEPITITAENRYLHVYHFRENLNKNFSLYIGDVTLPDDGDKGTKRWDKQLANAGVWEDVVVDLNWYIENATPVDAIGMLVDQNWGGDAEDPTNYYFDEIVLSGDNMPRGINIFTDTELSIDLGDDVSYDKWVSKLDLQFEENSSEIITNPFTDQSTEAPFDSIMKFNKSDSAIWWAGGPRFVLDGTLPVGTDGSSYLHIFVNIEELEADKDYYVVQLNAKDFSGNEIDSGDALKYWSDEAGTWIDMVLDVSALGYVSEFQVRFDIRRNESDEYIKSPEGVFYLDDIVINGEEEQRTIDGGGNAVINKDVNKSNIYSFDKNIVVNGNVAVAEVFDILGNKVGRYDVNGLETTIQVKNTGVYIVKSVQFNKKVSTTKVLIK
jgi:hypothetical protein